MYKISFAIAIVLLLNGCQKEDKDIDAIKNQLNKVEKNYQVLRAEIDLINRAYVDPYKIFEKVVRQELEKSPDTIILLYKKIIEKYPNSYWSHESKRRIDNILKRRHLWSEKDGWKLLNIKPSANIEPITCPGC